MTLASGLPRPWSRRRRAPNIDQMALWPNAADPHGSSPATSRAPPTGPAADRHRDRRRDDDRHRHDDLRPGARTPWGTILFGEEAGGGATGGRIYELIDPLDTTGVTLDRATGAFWGGGRRELGRPPGARSTVVRGPRDPPERRLYYGDENRPASGHGRRRLLQVRPDRAARPSDGPIADLSESPLAAGSSTGCGSVGGAEHRLRAGHRVRLRHLGADPGGARPDLRAQAPRSS